VSSLPKHRWRPSRLIQASALAHAGAAAAAILQHGAWPWSLGIIVADHALLTLAGLLPRCDWLGPNWTRLPDLAAACGEIAITVDDGPDPTVTPAVLDLLDRQAAKASFFCIGEKVRLWPDLTREIVDRGHAVENHSLRHKHNFALLGPGSLTRELESAQETLTAITGVRPKFFRAPAGLRNPFLDPVLTRLDLRLASWTRRGFDTRVGDAEAVSAKLSRGLAGGDILLLHDGNAARTQSGNAVILEILPKLLDAIVAAGLRTVTLRSVIE
jgi:peptidoglycan-N-acetylglucosamine deacetylase